jgi:uncharacterized membrane protein YhiD involved in acid resistance
MDKANLAFEQFLTTQSVQVPILGFLTNLILAGLLSWVLSLIYIRYGSSISNRKMFANNIILISVTTMVIITIVKSSLALSLGLVGALSIVRFRTAIKEPEELAYLFMAITIGLGLGADQIAIVFVAFITIIVFIIIKGSKKDTSTNNTSLFLTITLNKDTDTEILISDLTTILSNYCIGIKLKRYDSNKEYMEAVFQVTFEDIESMESLTKSLYEIDNNARLNIIDEEGVVV